MSRMMDLASQQVQKETLSACAPLATSAGTGLIFPLIRDILTSAVDTIF
jgi:hypothetical protein